MILGELDLVHFGLSLILWELEILIFEALKP